jgi:NADH-quinone oxidoreductase subunit L
MEHEDEAGYARFFTYLNLFVAAMLILVFGDSLVLTFVGWEGVGLCSYLLIGFWYKDRPKAFAGRKAFVTNRIGDFGFLIGLFALLSIFGTAEYGRIADIVKGFDAAYLLPSGTFAGWTLGAALTFATMGLFVGCTGKSAQIPLYVWLPDAMAGPTPVSALIHAATMVTAGVYLIARTSSHRRPWRSSPWSAPAPRSSRRRSPSSRPTSRRCSPTPRSRSSASCSSASASARSTPACCTS